MSKSAVQCPCGSGESIDTCCRVSLRTIELDVIEDDTETYLLDWSEKFAPACSETFHRRSRTFAYRISRYLDAVIDVYMPLGFPTSVGFNGDADKLYQAQKHSIALTIAGAFRLLGDGLFLQSGVLLRTAVESSLVLLDVAIHPKLIEGVFNNNYQSQSVLKRVKRFVPSEVVDWYGYFSANFTHVAALHQAEYMPRACFPDNWVIVTGYQDILRSIVTYNIMLERAYASVQEPRWMWKGTCDEIFFDRNSSVFQWAEELGNSIKEQIPTNNLPPGFTKSERSVTLKKRRRDAP